MGLPRLFLARTADFMARDVFAFLLVFQHAVQPSPSGPAPPCALAVLQDERRRPVCDRLKRRAGERRSHLQRALAPSGVRDAGGAERESRRSIMKQTRHKSVRTLDEYVREGRPFDDNPSDGIGL